MFVQSDHTKYIHSLPKDEFNPFSFPFPISNEQYNDLIKDLPMLGNKFQNRSGILSFSIGINSSSYDNISSFPIYEKNEINLPAKLNNTKEINISKFDNTSANTVSLDKRSILQLDHEYNQEKFISDYHIEFIYKW